MTVASPVPGRAARTEAQQGAEKRRPVGARGVRDRLRGTDPWAAVVGLVALAVYLINGFDGHLSPDLATYAYAGQRFADGMVPYEGVLNRSGPLAHALPGLGALAADLVGGDELTGMRVLFMLIAIGGVVLTYLLGRDVFRSRLAGVGAAGAMLCFRFSLEYASSGPRDKTVVMTLLLAAWCAAHLRRWATAGVMASLATLTWQPAFVWAGLPVALMILLVEHDHRVRALVRFAAAGLVPLALVVGVYLAIGRFSLFYEGFWLVNYRYTAAMYGHRHKPDVWTVMQTAYSGSVWVVVVGLAGLAIVTVGALVRRSPAHRPGTATMVTVLMAAVLGAVWTSYSFDGNSDTMPFLPEAALGVGALIGALVHGTVGRGRTVGRAVGVLATVVTVALALSYAVPRPGLGVDEQRARVAVVFDRLPPGATLLTADAPAPAVLVDKTNPTRFQRFKNGTWGRLQEVWPGGAAGYVRWIDRSGTTVLAIGKGPLGNLVRAQGLENYRRVGRGATWSWYLSTSVPTETRRAIREALRRLHARP